MLYQADQTQSDLMSPFRLLAQSTSAVLWLNKTEGRFLRKLSASMEVFSRMRLTHSRPAYNISTVKVSEQELAVTEETVLTMPFGTLLRETARTLLQDYDLYITDWHNARDVALSHGAFGLDDYIDHMIRFIQTIGPGSHVVAVC